MVQLPKEMTENGIHYVLYGDYYFPDFDVALRNKSPGKYGRMRSTYLQEYWPDFYWHMLLSGVLHAHLLETDQTCRDRMERIVRQMTKIEGVDEHLKTSDQMEWVSRMNSICQRAEETVLAELVFDCVWFDSRSFGGGFWLCCHQSHYEISGH